MSCTHVCNSSLNSFGFRGFVVYIFVVRITNRVAHELKRNINYKAARTNRDGYNVNPVKFKRIGAHNLRNSYERAESYCFLSTEVSIATYRTITEHAVADIYTTTKKC